jgi:hypothetical protein
MKRNRVLLLSAACLLLSSVNIALADEGNDLAAALTSGKVGVNVRARYEGVDQDGIADNADAATARLRLNYRTGLWMDWSGFAEYDHVFHVLDDFNSGGGTSPGKGQYPVVADPDGSDLNQLYLDYSTSEDWKVRVGRQRILLDNQRFVGGVGWRQNEQTYDAATFTTSAIQKTKLQYSYVSFVRRIFGDDVAAGKHNTDAHLLNAKVTLNDAWSVTPYFYYIDNKDAFAASTQTIGARVAGSMPAGDGKLILAGEFASQSDAGDNPVDYDETYLRLDGTWALKNGLSLGLSYESLGGDENNGGEFFRTPLATLHAFQGWADKFLNSGLGNIDGGIEDVFITAKYKAGKWNLTGVYHDFSAEAGGGDYGSEFDLSAGTKLAKNYGVLFKGAFFSSDSASYTDTTKFWIMFTANY